MESYALIAEQLRNYREKHGYTQKSIASMIMVARSTYVNYERGKRMPDVYVLDKLAQLYNVSIEAFIYPTNIYNDFVKKKKPSYEKGLIPTINLSDQEKYLLNNFRSMDDTSKAQFSSFSKFLLSENQ